MFASGFSWFHLIPGVGDDTLLAPLGIVHDNWIFVAAWFVVGLLVAGALLARRGLVAARQREGIERYFPDESLTPRNMAEIFAEGVLGLMADILSHEDSKAFFPLIGALFCYIFTCNILSIFPGMLPPTDNINTNVGMGILVFLVFNFVGIARDAAGYVKHLWGPMFIVGFLLFPIEIIGLVFRPVTLSLRLTGNMFGDHTVFTVMSDLAPWVVPAAFLGLAIFVSFMQAFVFSLLSTIYIGMSVPHHEHDEHHEHH